MYLRNFGQDCQGQADEAGCSFACGMEDADEKFQNLLNCMIDNDCMNKVTRTLFFKIAVIKFVSNFYNSRQCSDILILEVNHS